VRIIRSSTEPLRSIDQCEELSAGEIGEVIVKGANVSPEYLHRPDANKIGKIRDGEGFWHRMGDLGYLDQDGLLYYCGRRTHSVYTPERAFHSVPIEELFNALPKVRRSALVGVRGGRDPAIVIEPHPQYWPDSPELEERFHAELRALADQSDLTRDIQLFFFHRSFPVDARHNAKIFREQLAEWADKLLVGKRAA
jgi:acyl-CoA synthetase (AMP-forming)/AMP-acid ligase II